MACEFYVFEKYMWINYLFFNAHSRESQTHGTYNSDDLFSFIADFHYLALFDEFVKHVINNLGEWQWSRKPQRSDVFGKTDHFTDSYSKIRFCRDEMKTDFWLAERKHPTNKHYCY